MAASALGKAKPLPSRLVPASVMRMMAPRVAKPPQAAAAPPAAGNEAEIGAEPVTKEFPVTVALTASKSLGIDVDWSDGKTLFVKAVQPGAISDWNWDNASKAVKAGDRIVAVNGLRGDAGVMVRECRGKRQLQLVVRTKRRLAPSPKEVAVGDDPTGADGTSSPSSKKPRLTEVVDSLYAGMPAPDPEKDKSASSRVKTVDAFAGPPAPENPRRAVFLDIDGVLRRLEEGGTISIDGETLPLDLHSQSRAFAPEAVRALRYVVHHTGASVVLSSEWRRSSSLREEAATALRAVGLPPLRGATAVLEAREDVLVGTPAKPDAGATLRLRWAERRAREISTWLREHPEVEDWVALDDINLGAADEVRLADTLWMAPALVLTSASEGLTMSNARKAVEYLQRAT